MTTPVARIPLNADEMVSARTMTCGELQSRIRAAHARIGRQGRFALTLSFDEKEEAYITHWHRSDPWASEDCTAVGAGTLKQCLAALERYVSAYRRQPTSEEVGRTIGVLQAAG